MIITILNIIAHNFYNVKEMTRNKMKICGIICEYNPFHNGHLYQLQEAKKRSGADAVLCIMSGNFVQRGEAAVVDKCTRAKHAVLGGADAVIELPTVFATSNAELFAKGAISILSSIPEVTALCFGAENANPADFLQTARLMNSEPAAVSAAIKAYTAEGLSYAKARAKAWKEIVDVDLLSTPNNILGVEYTRAILQSNANIEILPIQRVGSGYHDTDLDGEFASATAIRAGLQSNTTLSNVLPDFVQNDLPKQLPQGLDVLEKYALLASETKKIARVCDCTEGLENAFKKAANQSAPLVDTLTSARYTSSRIRRIALQNLLNIEEHFIRVCLQSPLYLRVLAVKKERSDLLTALSKSAYPTIIRAHDENGLSGIAKQAYEQDIFAENVYTLLQDTQNKRNIFIP